MADKYCRNFKKPLTANDIFEFLERVTKSVDGVSDVDITLTRDYIKTAEGLKTKVSGIEVCFNDANKKLAKFYFYADWAENPTYFKQIELTASYNSDNLPALLAAMETNLQDL